MERLDIMVDIETLVTKSDATIFQISAIAFDINDGMYISQFNEVANISLNEKLTVDGDTLKWWLKTDKDLFARLLNSGSHSSEIVLLKFQKWLKKLSKNDMKDVFLWGNGILFDNKMIQHQMESNGLEYPIFYKNDRDVRTVLELASLKTGKSEQELKDMFKDDSLVAHDAIDDVKYQISLLINCYNILTK